MDLTTLTDPELEQLRCDVQSEQEVRANRARLPQLLEDARTLTAVYEAAGGDPADVIRDL